MKQINIWVVWAWIVGSDVIRILDEQKENFASKTWIILNLKSVYTRSPESEKSKDIYEKNPDLFKWQVNELYDDPDIDLIVETIWGLTLSKEIIEKSLNNNKSVVTANKDLIATNWEELSSLAVNNNQALKYEAAVAWWIPIINAIENWIVWDEIKEIRWIMNGTCNYMLTELEKWWSYEDMLKKAQELGYAESDPTNDVEGIDTAYKLAILMSVWFWKNTKIDEFDIKWISKLTEIDFKYAKLLSKKIKLLWVISKTRNKIWAFVSPVLLDKDSKMAKTDWVLNAIEVIWENATTFYAWPWAGWKATASAIISDIVNVAKFIEDWEYKWVINNSIESNLELLDEGDIESKYYCRFYIWDEAGVLAKITKVFADNNINIDQVIQHNHSEEEKNNLAFVITLEKSKDSDVKRAIDKIDKFDFIKQETFILKNLD